MTKAYAPGNPVTLDQVHSMLGVLSAQPNVSKGIITTTSDFAPGVYTDAEVQRFTPYRLDLPRLGHQIIAARLRAIATLLRCWVTSSAFLLLPRLRKFLLTVPTTRSTIVDTIYAHTVDSGLAGVTQSVEQRMGLKQTQQPAPIDPAGGPRQPPRLRVIDGGRRADTIDQQDIRRTIDDAESKEPRDATSI
jgi:hypothetical protein